MTIFMHIPMKGIKHLTEGPILRQLFLLAMPIMATSFIQMAYSLTDMAWVGRLGSEAIAAVGSVGLLTWMTTSISLLNKVKTQACAIQVAQAAPSVFQLSTKMNSGSRIMLMAKPIPLMVKGILLRPEALKMPVKAADMKTNGKALETMRR